METVSSPMVAAAKLLVLNLVIVNGDSPPPKRTIDGVEQTYPPTTAEENISNAVIYSFLANQSNSPQLNDEDLQQIDVDDLEEMDLKWQMAMLTMIARRFLNKTRRKISANGYETIRFNKSNVKCNNCHKRGHFVRECRAPRENMNREPVRRNMTVETIETKALVAQDGLGSDSESQLNVGAYKAGLESVESILDMYKKNEVLFEEDIKILKLDIKLRDNALIEPRKKFEKAEKERDNFKLALEKFGNSSKNLSKLLEIQVSDKFKTGIGYDSQVFDSQENDSESVTSIPDVATSEAKTSELKPKSIGEPLIEDWTEKEVIDSGCSRHMTGNKSYLLDYEEIDSGFVAFEGDLKGGKITGKGKISTGKLDFEDVYFVKELKFNLFSVSQMCDKKNSVLFTDTECVVLSPDFKLLDENHVLLRVPRKDNMYNVDLKNIVPSGGLTCLFAKARLDESNLWHMRLGHINFKTMNKLVRGNLVRGRKPALSFMRPFRYLVTIFNTLDHLGKFDGKADEGFFVGYSTNSKAFRVFNSRTRIVEENLHVKFSKATPNIPGSGPNWLFDIDALIKSINYQPVVAGNQSNGNAGTKACDDAGKDRMETVNGTYYILLPFLTQDPSFSSNSKDSPDAGFKPLGEEENMDTKNLENENSAVPNTKEPRVNQEQDESINITNNINIASLTVNNACIEDNALDENIVNGCIDDPNMPNLEEIVYSDDDKEVGAEADMNNLAITMPVGPILTTRVHKDHPLEQIIRDIHSAP
ncbi:ribonuclease H-like domain-containing protein [Tanacetum coccineum]